MPDFDFPPSRLVLSPWREASERVEAATLRLHRSAPRRAVLEGLGDDGVSPDWLFCGFRPDRIWSHDGLAVHVCGPGADGVLHRRAPLSLDAFLTAIGAEADIDGTADLPLCVDGAVGWFGHDAATSEPPYDPEAAPFHIWYARFSRFVLLDHRRRRFLLGVRAPAGAEQEALGRLEAELAAAEAAGDDRDAGVRPPIAPLGFDLDDDAYAEAFAACKRAVDDGTCRQIGLSRRLSAQDCGPAVAMHYPQWRSQWRGALRFCIGADIDNAAFGASPQRFCRLAEGRLSLQVLGGTLPSSSPDRADPQAAIVPAKERSEHDILVAADRRTLSLFCRPDSIRSARDAEPLRIGGLIHLASDLIGDLSRPVAPVSLLKSIIPAATVVGAPRQAALRCLARQEASPRGLYGGAVSLIRSPDRADHYLAIRIGWRRGNRLYARAGAGIGKESRLDDERHEIQRKLDAFLRPLLGVEA